MKVAHLFRDGALLGQALTHPSFANEHPGTLDNQRLEFLGDAVVGLVVTEILYAVRPDWPEGSLSRARSSLVRTETFAKLAEDLELGPSMRLAKGVAARGKLLADAFEAVTAAVWLDGGLDAARAFLEPLLRPLVEALPEDAPIDARSRLQELAEARGLPIAFRNVGKDGPPHAPIFTAEVVLDGVTYGPVTAPSKRGAAAAAAKLALAAVEGLRGE